MKETKKLYEGELPIQNPYKLPEGAPCFNILITHNNLKNQHRTGEAQDYKAAFAIPIAEASYHPDALEGAATLAYKYAQENDGLAAGLMAACAFYYLDDDAQGWVYFL